MDGMGVFKTNVCLTNVGVVDETNKFYTPEVERCGLEDYLNGLFWFW